MATGVKKQGTGRPDRRNGRKASTHEKQERKERVLTQGTPSVVTSMAQELAPHRIRVNAIAPGAIKTGINREAWKTQHAEAELLRLIPYGRVGEVGDVARAAVWLASDEADYINGATLYIDGGMAL
ncbi:MAG: SDR family oxidoreductase [Chromatiales bacterium]